MGSTVYPVYAALHRVRPSKIEGYGFPFDAERPDADDLTADGAELVHFLTTRASKCPNERVVLAGYSAGAFIAGDALSRAGTSSASDDHVVVAVLFSDPRFNPADRHTDAGTYNPAYEGGETLRPVFASAAPPIRSYCRAHDVVCQRHDPAANKDEHGRYVPDQSCEAIDFIAATLGIANARC